MLSVAPSASPRLIYGNICAAADSVDRAAAPIPIRAFSWLKGPDVTFQAAFYRKYLWGFFLD